MSEFLSALNKLSSAEDFFAFLDVSVDPDVVKVNRLHILKRFNQYIAEAGLPGGLDEAALKPAYAAHLAKAYEDFTHTTGVAEKMFKVFKQAEKARKQSFVGVEAVGKKKKS